MIAELVDRSVSIINLCVDKMILLLLHIHRYSDALTCDVMWYDASATQSKQSHRPVSQRLHNYVSNYYYSSVVVLLHMCGFHSIIASICKMHFVCELLNNNQLLLTSFCHMDNCQLMWLTVLKFFFRIGFCDRNEELNWKWIRILFHRWLRLPHCGIVSFSLCRLYICFELRKWSKHINLLLALR